VKHNDGTSRVKLAVDDALSEELPHRCDKIWIEAALLWRLPINDTSAWSLPVSSVLRWWTASVGGRLRLNLFWPPTDWNPT